MGSGQRAASKKCSWNEGLAHVPAMFGPNNPAQPRACGRLAQGQAAAGKREILPLAGLSPVNRAAKTAHRPLQAVAARRMVSPAQGLDETAEQGCLKLAAELGKAAP